MTAVIAVAPMTARRGGTRAQAVVVAISFSLLLAGTNAPTQLQPLYRRDLGFTPLLTSMTFFSYVGVLTVVLLLCARPRVAGRAPVLLAAALSTMVGADLLLASGTEPGILWGRALSGVAVGVGTGAAAALVVVAVGARGRSLAATGNLVGAVAGTLTAQLVVSAADARAIHLVFQLHGGACVVTLAALSYVLIRRRAVNRPALAAVGQHGRVATPRVRGPILPLVVGAVAWVAVSAALVFLPSAFAELGMPAVRGAGMVVLLGSCAAAQLATRSLARFLPWLSGLELLSVGLVAIAAGAFSGWPALALAGFACMGAGIGVAYRLGLVTYTADVSPAEHGARTSTYSAITYGLAAAAVLVTGAAGNRVGLVVAAGWVFLVVIAAALLLIRSAPRLRSTPVHRSYDRKA